MEFERCAGGLVEEVGGHFCCDVVGGGDLGCGVV